MKQNRDFSRRLAAVVNTAIIDAGRTQADIASATGITGSVLNSRLQGNVDLRAWELNAIAATLHTTAGALATAAELEQVAA